MRAHQLANSDRAARRQKIFELGRYFHRRDLETISREDVFANKDASIDTVEDIDQRYATLIMTFRRRVYAVGDFERLSANIDSQNIPGSYEAIVGLTQMKTELMKVEVLPLVLQSGFIKKIDLLFNQSQHHYLQMKAIKFLHQILGRTESLLRNREIRPYVKQQSVLNLLQSNNTELIQQALKMLRPCVEASLPFNSLTAHVNLLTAVWKITQKWLFTENGLGLALVVDLLCKYDRQALVSRQLSEIHSLVLYEILQYSIRYSQDNITIRIFNIVGGAKGQVRKICSDFQKKLRIPSRDIHFSRLLIFIIACQSQHFSKDVLEMWKSVLLNFLNYPYGQTLALDAQIFSKTKLLAERVGQIRQNEEKMQQALIVIEIITATIEHLIQFQYMNSSAMNAIFSCLEKWYKISNKKLVRKLNEAVATIVQAGMYLNLAEIMSQYNFIDLFFSEIKRHDGNTDKMSLKKLKDALIELQKRSPQKYHYIFTLLLQERNFKKVKSVKQDSYLNNVKEIVDYFIDYVQPIDQGNIYNVLQEALIEISE